MSLAALPPCPLCLYWSVCPILPQPSLLSASALSPALSTLSSRPRHAWAHPVCQLCSDAPDSSAAGGCWPCLAQLPLWPTPALAHTGHPCSGVPGVGLGKASLPLVSGPCPRAAEALQAHNTVFQEHTAPSSPGSAPSTRGFRRASEISIASQVSGMAESYTASGIAQSECSSAHQSRGALSCRGHCHPGPLCPPEDSWRLLGGATGIWWVETC